MKKWIFFLVFYCTCSLLSADLRVLYRRRLENSPDYRKAELQVRQAELALHQITDAYIPYIGIGGGSPGGDVRLEVDSGEFQSFSIALHAQFRNIFGVDAALSFPFAYDIDAGAGFEYPELTVSRKLFVETAADRLSAEAALLQRREAAASIRQSIWSSLIQEICDYAYYLESLSLQEEYADTLQKQIEASKNEGTIRSLKRQLYQMKRNVMEAESSIHGIIGGESDLSPGTITELYDECMELLAELERQLPGPGEVPPEQPELAALRLNLEAAERQADLWFLPYLPNPVFSAGITYDKDTQALDWNISLGISVEIIDRGERSLQALSRKENAEIARLEYERTGRENAAARGQAWIRKDILSIDVELSELNLEDKQDLAEKTSALYDKGYVSEEEYILSGLELQLAELARMRSRNQYLRHLLNILNLYGIGKAERGEK